MDAQDLARSVLNYKVTWYNGNNPGTLTGNFIGKIMTWAYHQLINPFFDHITL